MTGAQALNKLARPNVGSVLGGYAFLQVLNLGDDPRDVVVSMGGQPVTMRCLSGYIDRKEDDVVMAIELSSDWVVLGKVGTAAGSILTTDSVTSIVNGLLPPKLSVDWGTSLPGGYTAATSMGVRDDGGGKKSLFFVTGGSSPAPAPGPKPATVTIQPLTGDDGRGGWRGSQQSLYPTQGDASPYGASGAWVGGWFYGTQIADACAGKTVDYMKITVARRNTSHGRTAKVEVKMGTHTKQTISKPTIDNVWNTGRFLARGGSGTILINSTVQALLASGGRRGLGITSANQADYLICTPGCGAIEIGFVGV